MSEQKETNTSKQELSQPSQNIEIEENDQDIACKGRIHLVEGVSRTNFYTMLIVSLMTINFLVFLNAMQGFLLRETFDVDSDDLGTTTGYLGLADQIWSLITLALWGAGSDKLGRKTVVSLGFIQVGVASFLIPIVANVFPGVLIARLLYAQGASALTSMVSALLADYINKEDLGKATGLIGLTSGLGALLAIFLFVTELPPSLCINGTYFANGVMALAMSIVSFFGLKSLKTVGPVADTDEESDSESIWQMLKHGIILGYKNRNLGLAYLAGFLARGDSVILSIFISLWINQEYEDNDLCVIDENATDISFTTCNENFEDEDELTCPDAYTRFRILSGISQTFGLFVAPVIAIVADKMDPVKLLAYVSGFGGVTFGLVFFIGSVDDSFAIIAVSLWGMASIAMVLAAQFLLVKNMPEENKGTIAGCFSVIGALGVMFFTYFGGILFDEWFFGAPFALACFISFILMISAIRVKMRNNQEWPIEPKEDGDGEVPHYTQELD